MASNQALCGGSARKLFAPMFRARWQNMQNIVNDSAFISCVPAGYQTYYAAYIQLWLYWARGFVPQLHQSDFFSTGMGYTICDIYVSECMAGGYRYVSHDQAAKEFVERWDSERGTEVFASAFYMQNAGGNAILALTPKDGELYMAAYPIDRVFFQIGRSGKITNIQILNRFTAGETTYYARERRVMLGGDKYYRVDIAKGTLVTAPTWSAESLPSVPAVVAEQWAECYGDIEPNTWYAMPKSMRTLGVYNIKNKAVASALADMSGYSDSTLHTALDVLYSIDYNFTQSQVDQYMGKSRALVPKVMQRVSVTQPGTLADGMSFNEAVNVTPAPLSEDFFTEVPDNNINGDVIKPQFIQPDLRGEQHKIIRDADLELLAAKTGLSAGTIAAHLGENKYTTATQVLHEESQTERSVKVKRKFAAGAINDMIADVLAFYGIQGDVKIEWGAPAINSAQENDELLRDYQAGVLPLRTYLRKRWTDLTESEVEKMAQEIEEERRQEREITAEEYYAANYDYSKQTAEQASDSVGGSGDGNQEDSEE